MIRRVTGMTVPEAVEAEIVKPLDLDGMTIGAPPDARERVAQLIVQLLKLFAAELFQFGRRVNFSKKWSRGYFHYVSFWMCKNTA